MISIFDDNKAASKPKRKRSVKSKTSDSDKAALSKENLNKLNPMIIPLLSLKREESPSNDFIKSSIEVITERPHRLSDKWIASLNRWADSIIKAAMLDEPDLEAGVRHDFHSLSVFKIVPPKMEAEYPSYALIAVDSRGWKFYFKTSKANDFKAGDSISFSAKVSSHKEGITFLSRPSKIKKIASIGVDAELGET